MNQTQHTESDHISQFVRRTLTVILLVVLALLFWKIHIVFILAFAALIIGVVLHHLAELLSRHTPLSHGWALALVGLLILAFLAGFVLLLGSQISAQINQMAQSLPGSMKAVQAELEKTPWGSFLVQQMPSSGGSGFGMGTLGRITGFASALISVLTDVVLMLFLGIFFASSPGLYKNGVLMLLPRARRKRVGEALDAAGDALWYWLIGQLFSMLFVGLAVGVGLSVVGAPLPLALGLIAGLFDFVTLIGPLAAAIPGILLSLSQGPTTALLVAGIYFVVQQVEGNIITPLIQRRTVSLPPVLTILATVGSGMVFGIPGIIIGTPLAVVLLVLVKMLYVEDVLGDRVNVPGRD